MLKYPFIRHNAFEMDLDTTSLKTWDLSTRRRRHSAHQKLKPAVMKEDPQHQEAARKEILLTGTSRQR